MEDWIEGFEKSVYRKQWLIAEEILPKIKEKRILLNTGLKGKGKLDFTYYGRKMKNRIVLNAQ